MDAIRLGEKKDIFSMKKTSFSHNKSMFERMHLSCISEGVVGGSSSSDGDKEEDMFEECDV